MRRRKGLILGIVCIFVGMIGLGAFFFLKSDKNIGDIFHTNPSSNNQELKKNQDNYNGVYAYEEPLGLSYNIYAGCSVSQVHNYILIVEDNYEIYRSTCMGTYLQKVGNLAELKIEFDEGEKTYKINYNDQIFIKVEHVFEIVTNNQIAKSLRNISLSSLPFIIKETEFPGNYYEIEDTPITGVNGKFFMNVSPQGGGFYLEIKSDFLKEGNLYSYFARSNNTLPSFSTFFDKIIILEDNSTTDLVSYNLLTISQNQVTFNLKEKFPILVDGKQLTPSDPIYINYNKIEKNFHMFIGANKSFCSENEDAISYYEFKIDYNYNTMNLDNPEFVRTVKGLSGCNLLNEGEQ